MAYTSKQTAQEAQHNETSANKIAAPMFVDQRASTSLQLKQQQLMHAGQSPLQRMGAAEEEPLQGKFVAQRTEEEELLQGKFATAQLAEDEELLQGKFAPAQLAGMEEEESLQGKFETAQLAEEDKLLQGKFSTTATAQLEEKPNNTGLPNQLKAGIESLSGMSMDGVKVHYNSDKPAQLNAHAYAQGTDIHVAPGQEQHLPHEAWHVVQQAQGRVKPTIQMKAGVPVNDDVGLETEADVMGEKALSLREGIHQLNTKNSDPLQRIFEAETSEQNQDSAQAPIQRKGRIVVNSLKLPESEKKGLTPEQVTELETTKRQELKADIAKLKLKRRQAKKLATIQWVKTEQKKGGKGADNVNTKRDNDYNKAIELSRQTYEQEINKLKKEYSKYGVTIKKGDDYYGAMKTETYMDGEQEKALTYYKRPDIGADGKKIGKEYIKDKNGIFIRRYVRRELNKNDPINEDITSSYKMKTYDDLLKGKKVKDLEGMSAEDQKKQLTWDHRVFMQQSRGGGENQFALSHTSSHRPILSNDHKSFGAFNNGAILTDLAKVDQSKIEAQWEMHPELGHKIKLKSGKHKSFGNTVNFNRRDEKVRMSGYRNMEVLTDDVPQVAKAKNSTDIGWGGHDWEGDDTNLADSKMEDNAVLSYRTGESKRGNLMKTTRGALEEKTV